MLIDLHLREDILKNFPNFEYKNPLEPWRVDFTKLDNLVGQSQEAFINYWVIKQITSYPDYGAGLDIGCGQGSHAFTIGLNDYYGECHPIYRGEYLPHVTSLSENVDKIFNEGTFNFTIASHILEHVDEPMTTFRKWLKLLRRNGVMILLMPDYQYEKAVESWDPTHKTFWTPKDFEKNCIIPNADLVKVEEFNTLNNKFSMNAILRRT